MILGKSTGKSIIRNINDIGITEYSNVLLIGVAIDNRLTLRIILIYCAVGLQAVTKHLRVTLAFT